jgi:Heparinase II/III-like protein
MLLFVLGVALVTATSMVPLQRLAAGRLAEDPTTPFTMRDDFQGDSLGQWASYPPAQDVGYEPSLAPTTLLGARGGRSLMRVFRPTAAGLLRIGFIKHVPFIAEGAARLSFAYRLEAPDSAATIEIGLAADSGRLFASRVKATTGSWTEVRLGMADFAAGGSPPGDREGVQAVYIVGTLAQASPDVTYRFLLDDFTLTASRPAAFTVVTPTAHRLDPWPELVADVGYRTGSTVAFEVVAPVRMVRVESRVAPRGDDAKAVAQPLYDDGTHGDLTAGDGRWTNNAVLTLDGDDPPGIWTAIIRGDGTDGGTVQTGVRFMVHRSPTAHPRLYFGKEDRARLAARTRHARFARLWTELEERARTARGSGTLADGGRVFELLDDEYLLPSLPGYFDVLNRARQRIADNAIVAYVTGDAEATASARDGLLDVSRWSRWAPPWFDAHGQHTYYPAGQLAAAVALGYDLLYDQLTAEQRQAIRKALIERSILPTWREYVLDNRVMAHTSNWIAHTVGGALIAAAAIEGDTTPGEQAQIEPTVQGLLLKIESHMAASFLPDGSYGEGISYQEFDLETLGPMLHALERVFGIDYWARSNLLDSLAYPLATLATPTTESLDMGDTHPPAGHGISSIAYRSKDPVVRWYAARFEPRTIEDFIFFDDGIAPTQPPSPGSRFFADKGHVVFRGGWERDDALLLFRAGPTFNHHHADQGAFLFRAFGETLATEAGWSDYYKDPHYASFFTQAAGHNTVLMDGDPESQSFADTAQFRALDAYPRITDVLLSDTYDAVTSDLASVYKGRLSHYTRKLVFMKPDYLLVHDDLQVSGQPARFDWLLHVPNRSGVMAASGRATYAGAQAALAVRSLFPGANFRVADGPLPYATLATRTPDPVPARPAYLDLQSVAPAVAHEFLVALVPARTPEAANSAADRLTTLDERPWHGIETTRGEFRDLVLFRAHGATGAARLRDWTVDAATWSVTRNGSTLVQMSGHGLISMMQADRILVRAERPVSLIGRYRPSDLTVICATREATPLTLAVGGVPSRVELNGRVIAARADRSILAGHSVTIDLPAGRHALRIGIEQRRSQPGAPARGAAR